MLLRIMALVALVFLGACSAPGGTPRASLTGGAQPQWQCTPGTPVNVHKPYQGPAIQHDFVHLHDTSDARQWMNLRDEGGKLVPLGDKAIPTFQALRAVETGKSKHNLKRYMGGGELTYTVYYAEHDKIPDRVWYLTRFDVCIGSVPVRKFMHEGKWAWSFSLPIAEGGAHPLFERRVLQNAHRTLLLCVTSSVNIYTPTLTAGPAAGQQNTLCSLPGSTPGTTRIDEVSRDSLTTWVMFVAVLRESSGPAAAPQGVPVTPPGVPSPPAAGAGNPRGHTTRFTIPPRTN